MKNTVLKEQNYNETFDKSLKEKVITTISERLPPYVVEEIDTDKLNIEKKNQQMEIRLATNQPKSTSANSQLRTFSVAMIYQNKSIGEIDIILPSAGNDLNKIRTLFERIAMDIVFFIKRHQTHYLLSEKEQLDLQWIGNSESLKCVERFIEKVSSVDLPVLIQGQRGSGKLLTAYSIHYNSSRQQMPFVESHCLDWELSNTSNILKGLFAKAEGGTLFLRDIDLLSDEQISILKHYLRHFLNTTNNIQHQLNPDVRIIASTSNTCKPEQRKSWQDFDYLSTQLPDLNDRREDIKELVSHYLHKLSYIKRVELSPNCWELFEKFHWEGNVKQLEQIVSKLVVMSDSNYLNPSSLLAIIPQLQDTQGSQIQLNNTTSQTKASIYDISQKIINNNYASETNLHPALIKAIDYLAQHFSEDINLSKLSSVAFVSPSHLSYLFKHYLNSSFKKLLIQIRIDKAKQKLMENQHCRITEIAYDVGFHDLSHFEKTFKKIVGYSPGQFRKIESCA